MLCGSRAQTDNPFNPFHPPIHAASVSVLSGVFSPRSSRQRRRDGGKPIRPLVLSGSDAGTCPPHMGGPWPTEFHLRAMPHDSPFSEAAAMESAGAFVFHRRGPRCRQVWTLDAIRERPAYS
ncbi:MAG TPA: hypothetical protein VN688_27610 [Gemmataceae bacterium]|nr:hypothetical protein [Gemmataceae bacterium]